MRCGVARLFLLFWGILSPNLRKSCKCARSMYWLQKLEIDRNGATVFLICTAGLVFLLIFSSNFLYLRGHGTVACLGALVVGDEYKVIGKRVNVIQYYRNICKSYDGL